jgi:hypothetical protein
MHSTEKTSTTCTLFYRKIALARHVISSLSEVIIAETDVVILRRPQTTTDNNNLTVVNERNQYIPKKTSLSQNRGRIKTYMVHLFVLSWIRQ